MDLEHASLVVDEVIVDEGVGEFGEVCPWFAGGGGGLLHFGGLVRHVDY